MSDWIRERQYAQYFNNLSQWSQKFPIGNNCHNFSQFLEFYSIFETYCPAAYIND